MRIGMDMSMLIVYRICTVYNEYISTDISTIRVQVHRILISILLRYLRFRMYMHVHVVVGTR